MTKYNKIITEEGKNEILKIAFSNEGNENTFKYLALGENGSSAAETGNAANFHEVSDNGYSRPTSDGNVEFDENGTATISFIIDENNCNNEVEITEIALCNADINSDIPSGGCTCFAFCEVPPIVKTGNISLKYTLKISIE